MTTRKVIVVLDSDGQPEIVYLSKDEIEPVNEASVKAQGGRYVEATLAWDEAK
jgi:hypothetical protein